MFGQTFEMTDLARLLPLAFIELLLSADNAVVLGLLAYALPERQRKRALFIGLASSFFFRAAALLSIALLIRHRWVQLLGAAYLFYIALRHFMKKKRRSKIPPATPSFWTTVLLIELYDVAFAIDSIIAGLAFIAAMPLENAMYSKLWIVYVGGMLGLIAVRYAADLFTSLLQRFPRLETSAYLMVAWIGLKLALSTFYETPSFEPVFWVVLAFLFSTGLLRRRSA